MAVTEERIKIAQGAKKVIAEIAKEILQEWDTSFEEIQKNRQEIKFDLEILSRIKENSVASSLFQVSKSCTADNYGMIWERFTEDEQNIIALKELKLW